MSEGDTRGLDRRQLLKAGAWAAPALVLAAAVPAAAASGPIVPEDMVRLTANCATTVGRETNHGFTVSNGKAEEVTVIVTFTATAQGVLRLGALANLISAAHSTVDSCCEREPGRRRLSCSRLPLRRRRSADRSFPKALSG